MRGSLQLLIFFEINSAKWKSNIIQKAESKSKPQTSHDFGGGYIGEALSSLNGT